MCAIAGILGLGDPAIIRETLVGMLASQAHRGPDDQGLYERPAEGLWLGHRRLAIIDLSAGGHQPMEDAQGDLVVTFNGEIYNYRELRAELERQGHRFRSTSDTEIILAGYRQWGMSMLQRFRGMFAFALWDRRRGRLFLARDRAGVKPLFIMRTSQRLYFASEMRAFRCADDFDERVSPAALRHFLRYGYVTAPWTIFAQIETVKPGHYLEVGTDGTLRETCYWDIADHYLQGYEDECSGVWEGRRDEDVADELEEILTEAFRYRLVADVPVGMFLSGGVDSSLVAALLIRRAGADLRTFTIGYDDPRFDEAPRAKAIADHLGTDHTELYLQVGSEELSPTRIASLFDEPIGDNSALPTHLVSRLAADSVKVALSADGGDELFAGYTRYRAVDAYMRWMPRLPRGLRTLIGRATGNVPARWAEALYGMTTPKERQQTVLGEKLLKLSRFAGADDLPQLYHAATGYWDEQVLEALVQAPRDEVLEGPEEAVWERLRELPVMHRIMCYDFKKYMVHDVLAKVDRASMSVSIEAREPFMDHRLVEYAARLPLRYKFRDDTSKYLLRKILRRHLPADLMEVKKQGFSMPIESWLRGPLRTELRHTLTDDGAGPLNGGAVREALHAFERRGQVSAIGIWHLFEFDLWRRQWVKGDVDTG